MADTGNFDGGYGRNLIKHAATAGLSVTPSAPAAVGLIKRPVVEARAEARRILDEAERRAAEMREAAHREGRETAAAEFTQLILDAHAQRDAAMASAERDVLRLSVKLAEKIIGREIEADPATLADIVSTALRQARQHEAVVVRVNPADLAHVNTQRERLDPAGRARFIDLVADPRVAHGGCRVETESGTIDAQLETQLRVLERALLARAAAEGG